MKGQSLLNLTKVELKYGYLQGTCSPLTERDSNRMTALEYISQFPIMTSNYFLWKGQRI